MASLRDIRTRIGSVKNTRQITSAMKLVSGAKLKRATDAATNARPYQQTLAGTLQRVAARAGDVENPLLVPKREVKKIALVVYGSDRGLCAGFNSTLARRTEERVREWREAGVEVVVRTYGKKSRDQLKNRGIPAAGAVVDLRAPQYADEATRLADWLAAGFLSGEFDEAWLGFNAFKSVLTQVPTFPKVLPLSLEASGADAPGVDFLFEPDGASILNTLLPLYLRTLLLQAFLETEAGEHAARMTAMDSATRNATDLIGRLTLEYNRSRQAAITKELIEIISGAEAL